VYKIYAKSLILFLRFILITISNLFPASRRTSSVTSITCLSIIQERKGPECPKSSRKLPMTFAIHKLLMSKVKIKGHKFSRSLCHLNLQIVIFGYAVTRLTCRSSSFPFFTFSSFPVPLFPSLLIFYPSLYPISSFLFFSLLTPTQW